MSRSLRTLVLTAAIFTVVVSVGVLVLFFKENAQWVLLRVPAIRPSLGDPFYVVEYESPLWVVMLTGLGAGCMLTALALVPSWIRRAVDRRRDQRYIRDLEGELADLRNLAITAPAPLEDLPAPRAETREAPEGKEALAVAALDFDDQERAPRGGR